MAVLARLSGLQRMIRSWRTDQPTELASQLEDHQREVDEALRRVGAGAWPRLRERVVSGGAPTPVQPGELILAETWNQSVTLTLPQIGGDMLGAVCGVAKLRAENEVRVFATRGRIDAVLRSASPLRIGLVGMRIFVATTKGWWSVAEHDLVDVGLGARRVVSVTADRALQASDAGATLIPSGGNREITIPTDESDPLPNGFAVQILQAIGARSALLAWAGITLVGSSERRTYFGGDRLFLVKRATNTWNIYADCSASGTYTPTVHSTVGYSVNSTNGWWIRVGNIVHMGITILGRTVGTGPNRQVLISLPIARSGNFPNNNVVGGSANYGTRTTNNVFPAQIGTEGGTQHIRLNAADPSADDRSRTWSASLYYSLD